MEYIPAKTIIRNVPPNRNYLPYEYAMDLYRGCNHGCIYCYARSNYYEKTDHFECIRVKEDALKILRNDLLKRERKGIILNGCVADPYNILEKECKLTRNALELINAFEFGACFITKSDLVTRDTDILMDIKENAPVSVNFSITCAEDEMSLKMEPGAPVTSKRFEAIEHLSKNGIITGVLMDPVTPYLTDTEENVREMVKKSKHSGARYIYISTSVTMADIQREYFLEEAEKISPGISQIYKDRYKEYYRCKSPKAKKLYSAFVDECEKQGMNYDMKVANSLVRQGYNLYEKNLGLWF